MNDKITLFILTSVVAVFGSFTFILVKQSQRIAQIEKKYYEVVDERDTYKARASQLEDDSRYLLEDRAKSLKPYTEVYAFSSLGIKSPLFDGKEVTVSPYSYRGQNTLAKSITISEEKSETGAPLYYGVTVWQFDPKMLGTDLSALAIFDGYENRGSPSKLSDRIGLKDSVKVKTNQGLIFEIPNVSAKQINFEGISIHAYEKDTILSRAIFIKVWVGNVNIDPDTDRVAVRKKHEIRLKEIAESISIR